MASLVLLELVLKTLESMIAKGNFPGPFYTCYLNLLMHQFKSVKNKYTNGMAPYKILLERDIFVYGSLTALLSP